MTSSSPLYGMVDFVGNGVIYKNKFFPFKTEHITETYPYIDCKKITGYIALYKISLIVIPSYPNPPENSWVGIAGEMNSEGVGIDKGYCEHTANNTYQSRQWQHEYKIVLDQGTQIEFDRSDISVTFHAYVIYAEIETLEADTQTLVKQNCDLWSWIKGECVHGD